MATTYETDQIFNEDFDRLAANLMANLNKTDGRLETQWSAAHAEEYMLDGGQYVRQIVGVTTAFSGPVESLKYVSFVVKLIALSPTTSRAQIVVVSPSPTVEVVRPLSGSLPDGSWHMDGHDGRRLESIAALLLDFCVNPDAETDTGIMRWLRAFKDLMTPGKDKRKPGDEA